MNSYRVTGIIKESLWLNTQEADSPLKGIFISTDPYASLENNLPFILIEEGITRLAANPEGYITEYLHTIEITCAVNAANCERDEYKKSASLLAENCLNVIGGISDYRLRLIPTEMSSGELIAGGAKCSGVKILIEVKTLFKEE